MFDDALTDSDGKAFGYLSVGSPRHHDGAFFNTKEPGAVFVYADLAEQELLMSIEGEELSYFGGGGIQQVPSEEDMWVAAGAIADNSFGVRRGGSVSLWRI